MSEPHPSAEPASLHYAPKRTWHERFVGRWLVTTSIVTTIAISALIWGDDAWRKVQLLYWQSRCMGYVASPDRLIDSDPAKAVPREWERFYALYSPPGMRSAATIYLHERTSPAGNRRLVVLDVHATEGQPAERRIVLPRVFVPGGLFNSPRQILGDVSEAIFYDEDDLVFRGQSDPADPSHFTFVIESAEGPRTIDGWLEDDDTVTLEPREPLVAAPVVDELTASPSSASRPHPAPATPAGRRSSGR